MMNDMCSGRGGMAVAADVMCVDLDDMCCGGGDACRRQNIAGRTYVVRLAWPCKRCHIRFEAMNNFTKYLIYLLAVAIVLVVMLLLKDNISLWLSRVGTYVLMFGFTFFAGWLLGHMGGRAECRRRTEELQRRIDELEGNH